MKSKTEITVFDRRGCESGYCCTNTFQLVKLRTLLQTTSTEFCDKMQPFICRTIKSRPTMTRIKSASVLLVPFSVLQIVALMTESVNGGPVDPSINTQSAISEPGDKGVEVLTLKTAVSYPSADSSPTDYTLTIVAPIAAGIFLMVVAFFLYLVSEKNVASEATDYESLTEETEDESVRPSTSGAAGPSQIQVENATTS